MVPTWLSSGVKGEHTGLAVEGRTGGQRHGRSGESERVAIEISRGKRQRQAVAQIDRPVADRIQHRRQVACHQLGGDHHRVGDAIDGAVIDDQLDRVVAGDVGHKVRVDGRWIRQRSRASAGRRDQRPGVGQGIVVGIGRAAAVKLHGVVDRNRLVGAGVGRRRLVVGSDDHRGRLAVQRGGVDNELHHVEAGHIRCEGGGGGYRIGQAGRARIGRVDDRPFVGHRVEIGVGRARSVELDLGSGEHALLGARVGDRAGVDRGDGHRVDGAIGKPVIDDELGDVGAGLVGDEGRRDRRGVGDRRVAAFGLVDQRPVMVERIEVDVE